ncbi:hypothetical protein ATANTOWER_009582 [Ataeniobius toweri]|uniref:L27 domain-containing protein n=1 Tax=Ataeniobius toweri TaxID=208326 RepID=A0ABU7BZD8_9TELE|nr:hypothetical protein [Ataeniobius toweri]
MGRSSGLMQLPALSFPQFITNPGSKDSDKTQREAYFPCICLSSCFCERAVGRLLTVFREFDQPELRSKVINMTVANAKSGSAMQQVLDNLKDMPSGTGAKDIDLIFLKGIMESPIVRSLAKVRHKLTQTKLLCILA